MGCKLCEDMLMEYLYGELDEENTVMMGQHLSSSEPCRKEYREIQSTLAMAGEMETEELPPGLHTRIMAHAAEHDGRLKKRPAWARLFRPALTTAVVMVIATSVYLRSARIRGPLEVKQAIELDGSSSELPGPFHMAKSLAPETEVSPREDQEVFYQDESLEEKVASGPEMPGHGVAGGIGQGSSKGIASLAPAPGLPKKRKMEASQEYRATVSATAQGAREEVVHTEIKEGVTLTDLREEDDFSLAAVPQMETKGRMAPKWNEECLLQEAELPAPLAEAVELARSGFCEKALEEVQQDATRDRQNRESGFVWLELADCFLKKGDNEKASNMASKALEIPACSRRAEAFLQRMGVLPEQARPGR